VSNSGGGFDYNEKATHLALRHHRRICFERAQLCGAQQRRRLDFNNEDSSQEAPSP
jgi:hypothetical protein